MASPTVDFDVAQQLVACENARIISELFLSEGPCVMLSGKLPLHS